MRTIVIVLVALMAIFSNASGYKLDDDFKLEGNGILYSKTITAQAQDQIIGFGNQTYHRNVLYSAGIASMTSNYELQSQNSKDSYYYGALRKYGYDKIPNANYPNYESNRYVIGMTSPNGLRQFVSVSTNSRSNSTNLSAKNHIEFKPRGLQTSKMQPASYKFATNFDIRGNGSLFEIVSDLNANKREQDIAKTSLSGKFQFKSKFTDSLTISQDDIADMSAKVDDVNTFAERAPEKDTSKTVDQLERMMVKGSVTDEDFVNSLNEMVNNGRMDEADLLNKLMDAKKNAIISISDDEYTDIKIKTLNELTDKLKTGQINGTVFEQTLKKMLNEDLINQSEYDFAKSSAIRNFLEENKVMLQDDTINEREFLEFAKENKVNQSEYNENKDIAMMNLLNKLNADRNLTEFLRKTDELHLDNLINDTNELDLKKTGYQIILPEKKSWITDPIMKSIYDVNDYKVDLESAREYIGEYDYNRLLKEIEGLNQSESN